MSILNRWSSDTEQKRLLRKLILAQSDISSADLAADHVIKTVKGKEDKLLPPLTNAVVVSYGRPFSDNKPFGPLPRQWRKFKDSEHQRIHKLIIDMRNTIVAHSDQNARTVLIIPPGHIFREAPVRLRKADSSPYKEIDPNVIVNKPMPHIGFAASTKGIEPELFPAIRDLCNNLTSRLLDEIDQHLKDLFDGKELPEQPFELGVNLRKN